MRYYKSDDALAIAKEHNGVFYRYDWVKRVWVPDAELFGKIALGGEWYDEITKQEAVDAITSRTVPVCREICA